MKLLFYRLLVFIFFVILILFELSNLNIALANGVTNTETQINNAEGLRIDLVQNVQDPDTKVVRFDMIINSGIDSDRVLVTWTIIGNCRFLNPDKSKQALSVKKGGTYVVSIDIIPTGITQDGFGVSEIIGKAEAFFVNTSVVSSLRKKFFSNFQGEIIILKTKNDGQQVVEPPDEYLNAVNMRNIRNIVTIIMIISIVIAIAFFLGYRFLKYLNKDDVY